jgi:hypothetical protein
MQGMDVTVTRLRLFFLNVLMVLVIQAGLSTTLPAHAAKVAKVPPVTLDVQVVGADPASKDVKSVLDLVQDLLTSSNRHDLDGILKHYSSHFVSGDNLTLTQVRQLIEETWKVYPNIHYETKTLEIRINGDWATVESIDNAKAEAKAENTELGQNAGTLASRSRGLLFLHRIGKSWEIVSDYTMYENATILFGDAKTLEFGLSAPDQVFSGESYTAKVNTSLPEGAFAIVSISKDPLVHPQLKPDEKFRSLSSESNALERVFAANETNNNEIVTATVGLTQIGQDAKQRPTFKLNGVATLVKRVNVLPKSKFKPEDFQEHLINRSASGLIDMSSTPPAASEEDKDSAPSGQKEEIMPESPDTLNPTEKIELKPETVKPSDTKTVEQVAPAAKPGVSLPSENKAE